MNEQKLISALHQKLSNAETDARENNARLGAAEARIYELRAALERARALLAELVSCGYECEAGALENNAAYRELAALLAAAPGGAA